MKGEWVMFRLKPRPGERQEPWMLKKVDDEFAKPEEGDALVEHCVTSITTDRSMAEIAAGTDVWRSNRGGKKGGRQKREAQAAPPEFKAPQLATLVDAVPTGNDWLHEYKYDGYRLLISTAGGAATAWTRKGNDWSDKFRSIVRAAAKLPAGCLIDGEAVALDENGKLTPADRWQVFEERSFRSRRNELAEPREAVISDVTGDGKNDLIVVVHDRLILYPQE